MTDSAAGVPRRVLNVGGGSKKIPIPQHYAGWEHVLLDIDPAVGPDIVCDARQLDTLPAQQFDAVYCSHNLEHYYRHDTGRVLRGFLHVLKQDGFAEIRVPDLRAVMQKVVRSNMDINDVLYQSPAGPISVQDVIYGLGREIEQTRSDFYAHKTGYTPQALGQTLEHAGFGAIFMFAAAEAFETRAVAFKSFPTPDYQKLLHLPVPAR
jgi:predicted SAM-dependent methyltransferase